MVSPLSDVLIFVSATSEKVDFELMSACNTEQRNDLWVAICNGLAESKSSIMLTTCYT